jgi:hypothetical protein
MKMNNRHEPETNAKLNPNSLSMTYGSDFSIRQSISISASSNYASINEE